MADRKPVILVVDDERGVQRVVQRLLERAGYEAVVCAGLEEVTAKMDQGLVPDLLIADWQLPYDTGRSVALAVRRRAPGTPVLFMSGYDEIEGIDPAEPMIRKPFRGDELAAVVRRVLEAGTVDVLIGETREASGYARRPDVSGQHRVVKVEPGELEQAHHEARVRRPRRPT